MHMWNESVALIDNGKVYIDAWIEEGWDDENDCATDDYKYYGKVIIKDFQGNVISEEIGSLYQGQEGLSSKVCKYFWLFFVAG